MSHTLCSFNANINEVRVRSYIECIAFGECLGEVKTFFANFYMSVISTCWEYKRSSPFMQGY
jgi:hypothetical protein